MRLSRVVSVTAVVLASLVGTAVAQAEPVVSVDPIGQLGPEGASAVVSVSVTCDPGAAPAYPGLFVTLAQSTGNRLEQGSAGTSVATTFVCDGAPHPIAISITPQAAGYAPLRPFKAGGAAVTARLSYYNPASGYGSVVAGPTEIRLRK